MWQQQAHLAAEARRLAAEGQLLSPSCCMMDTGSHEHVHIWSLTSWTANASASRGLSCSLSRVCCSRGAAGQVACVKAKS